MTNFRKVLGSAASQVANILLGGKQQISDVWTDLFRSRRAPSKKELIEEYRNLAYSLANLNARAVASVPYRLFVRTSVGEAAPKCTVKSITPAMRKWLETDPGTAARCKGAEVQEVVAHPLLTLLEQVNSELDGYTLFEMTDLYQEIVGTCYWWVENGAMDIPAAIWLLPPQSVEVKRDREGGLKGYRFAGAIDFQPEELIRFKFPNLKDPYGEGWSPVRAAFEEITLANGDLSWAQAMLDNNARPDVWLTPKEAIGPAERQRLERQFNARFSKRKTGGVLVTESSFDMKVPQFNSKQLESLARRGATKEDLANAFDIPISLLLTRDVNRANAEAGHYQHAKLGVLPRLRRLQAVLNAKLCPMFSDRLMLVFDNPVPEDAAQQTTLMESRLRSLVTTINMERERLGEEPVPWGDRPWAPTTLVPLGEAQPDDESTDTTVPADTSDGTTPQEGEAGDKQEIQATEATVLNGAQIQAAIAICQAVAAGQLPRDTGIGLLQVGFNLTREAAEQMMASAGNPKVPTTPNPGAAVEAPSSPSNAAGDEEEEDEEEPEEGKEPPKKPKTRGVDAVHAGRSDGQGVPVEGSGSVKRSESFQGQLAVLLKWAARDLPRHKAVAELEDLGLPLLQAIDWTAPADPMLDDMAEEEKQAGSFELLWQKLRQRHGRNIPEGRALEQVLRRTFAKQRRQVLARLEKSVLGVETKAWWDEKGMDLSEWDEDMAKDARPYIEIQYDAGAKQTLGRLGYTTEEADWNVANPKTREAIDRATMKFSKETNATTSKQLTRAIAQLRQELAEGIVGEENTGKELTRRVMQVFDHAEEWRAGRIALTESSRAVHDGQVMAAKETGIVKGKKWLLSDDACELCKEIAAKHPDGVGLDENFYQHKDGAEEYRDVPFAPAHPYCMCSMEEIIDENALKE